MTVLLSVIRLLCALFLIEIICAYDLLLQKSFNFLLLLAIACFTLNSFRGAFQMRLDPSKRFVTHTCRKLSLQRHVLVFFYYDAYECLNVVGDIWCWRHISAKVQREKEGEVVGGTQVHTV